MGSLTGLLRAAGADPLLKDGRLVLKGYRSALVDDFARRHKSKIVAELMFDEDDPVPLVYEAWMGRISLRSPRIVSIAGRPRKHIVSLRPDLVEIYTHWDRTDTVVGRPAGVEPPSTVERQEAA